MEVIFGSAVSVLHVHRKVSEAFIGRASMYRLFYKKEHCEFLLEPFHESEFHKDSMSGPSS